jgi:hypothetical protein
VSPEEQQKTGASMWISEIPRIPPESVDPSVKNYHWLDLDMALFDAYDHDAQMVVLRDLSGAITEGPGYNIFAYVDGRWLTPASGTLMGVTRRTLLDLCAETGHPAEEGRLTADQLLRADEVLTCTTAGGVMPVTTLNGKPIGDGLVGPRTTDLAPEPRSRSVPLRRTRTATMWATSLHDHAVPAVQWGTALGASLAAVCTGTRLWCGNGRSEATHARAVAAGLTDVGSIEALTKHADVIVSVCPPASALEVAAEVAAVGFDGIYVDVNAISPATTRTIGSRFARFVDCGVVGPPVRSAGSTRLYLAGDEADRVSELWRGTALDARGGRRRRCGIGGEDLLRRGPKGAQPCC